MTPRIRTSVAALAAASALLATAPVVHAAPGLSSGGTQTDKDKEPTLYAPNFVLPGEKYAAALVGGQVITMTQDDDGVNSKSRPVMVYWTDPSSGEVLKDVNLSSVRVALVSRSENGEVKENKEMPSQLISIAGNTFTIQGGIGGTSSGSPHDIILRMRGTTADGDYVEGGLPAKIQFRDSPGIFGGLSSSFSS